MRYLYLALAVIGCLPWLDFHAWFTANGWSLGEMIDAWYANRATAGLVRDLTIAALVLTIWVIAETWRTRDMLRLLAIPATFAIGVSCGLPLYLYLRERRG
ncbi:DUF2834 domain-containing protein [Rhodobacterales bacterium HKCCE2091]|nr:DUF2834 domain-containing protein [Rhodobacterales bacterium HKCCE2091]